jgi:hypothetical protein
MKVSKSSALYRYSNMVTNLRPATGRELLFGCFISTGSLAMLLCLFLPVIHHLALALMLVVDGGATYEGPFDITYTESLPYQGVVVVAALIVIAALVAGNRFIQSVCDRITVE